MYSKDVVEFDLTLELVVVEYPKEPIALLAFNIKAPLASPNNEAPPASPNNEAPLTTVEEFDSNYDDSLIIDKETGEDSENSERCSKGIYDPRGIYLKKIKNDCYRYIVTCKNEACDWRLHGLCLPNNVTYMIKNVYDSHSLWRRVVQNKEVNASEADFKLTLKSVGRDSVDAISWLMSEPIDKWARHAFDSSIKSDHITNNMSICFNGWIKDERDKPILTLLKLLSMKIMVWYCEKWEEIEKWNDSMTPYAREQLLMNENYKNANEVVESPVKRREGVKPKKARRKVEDEPRAPIKTFSNKAMFSHVWNMLGLDISNPNNSTIFSPYCTKHIIVLIYNG
ncbi:hypothetical protein ACOSP7_004945 [Xanthoceras sorbifolium]